MIRVVFEDRDEDVIDATESSVGPAGELVLNLTEVEQRRNPQNLGEQVSVVVARTWRRTYLPAARVLYCEPVDDEGAGSNPAPLEEVYAR